MIEMMLSTSQRLPYVYVAISSNIVKIDQDGNKVWTFTGHNNSTQSVAVDPNGNVYSSDADNIIKKIDPDGNQIWSSSYLMTGVPQAVAVDSVGNVYYGGGTTLGKIDSDGSLLWNVNRSSGGIVAVAPDTFGNVYIGAYYGDGGVDGLEKYSALDGSRIWSYDVPASRQRIFRVSTGFNGYVYYTINDSNGLRRINDDKTNDLSLNTISTPTGLAIDDNEDAYAGGTSGIYYKVNTLTGNIIWQTNIGISIQGVGVFESGDSYLGLNDGSVKKIDSLGNEVWSSQINTGQIIDIAVDPGKYGAGFWN